MSQLTLIRGARQLLTLAGPDGIRSGPALQSLSVIPDGSVLIQDGIIVEIGSTRRLENLKLARAALEIDAHGCIVMPGFIDPGLRVTLHAANGRARRVGQLHDDTLDLLRSCVVNGTLIAELKGTAAADDFHSDLSVLRRLAKIGENPAGTVRCWQLDRLPESGAQTTAFLDMLDYITHKKLIHFLELPIADNTVFHPELLAGILNSQAGVKLLWSGTNPAWLSQSLCALRPVSLFCNKTLGADERAVLANFEGPVVFAPGRGLGNAGLTGLREAIDAGLPIALSSGYDAELYPAYSMQMAVSLAAVYGLLTIEEAITAATVNAAHAVGRGQTHGSLMRGKRADILIMNLPDYREIPRQFGINHLKMALRNGEAVINRAGWKMGTHEAPVPDRVRTQRVGGP